MNRSDRLNNRMLKEYGVRHTETYREVDTGKLIRVYENKHQRILVMISDTSEAVFTFHKTEK